ncbi:MAG: hypothetical protein SFU25_03580 [Candidatus Caenarcaniphilales bacterium]|nr:hypothetical protein [Candidatus Caenarcaniphilales bacterium]
MIKKILSLGVCGLIVFSASLTSVKAEDTVEEAPSALSTPVAQPAPQQQPISGYSNPAPKVEESKPAANVSQEKQIEKKSFLKKAKSKKKKSVEE